MPTTHFYKKASPKVGVYLSNGGSIRFDQITPAVGVYKTDEVSVQREFAQAMNEGRGGISELSEQEYQDLLKKKRTGLQPPWQNDLRRKAASALSKGVPVPAAPVAAGKPSEPVPKREFVVSKFKPVARPRIQ
jgi:hypothetical protein